MLVRFDIRPDDQDGWTIYDRMTGEAAVVDGLVPAGLSREEADDLVDLFNTLDVLKRQATLH